MYQDNGLPSRARDNYYSIPGVPHSVIDGNYFNGHPSGWSSDMSLVNARAQVPSPFDLSVEYEFNPSTLNIDVEVILECTQTVSSYKVALHTVAIERNIYWDTPPGSNGETHFEHVMKLMLPDTGGYSMDKIAGQWVPGDKDTVNYSIPLTQFNLYEFSELAFVAFIQDNSTKRIHQTDYAAPKLPFSQNDIQLKQGFSDEKAFLGGSASYTFERTFLINAPVASTYTVDPTANLPSGWTWSMEIDGNTYTSPASIQCNTKDSIEVELTITTDQTKDVSGTVGLQVMDPNFLPSEINAGFEVEAVGPVSTLLIDLLATQNSQDKFHTALSISGYTYFDAYESDLRFLTTDFLTDDNVEQIIYFTGNIDSLTLPSDVLPLFESYLEDGGELLIVSQDMAYEAFDPASPSSYAALTTFLNNYFGFTYTSNGDDQVVTINAETNDDFFWGVSDGTRETNGFYLSSDRIFANPN